MYNALKCSRNINVAEKTAHFIFMWMLSKMLLLVFTSYKKLNLIEKLLFTFCKGHFGTLKSVDVRSRRAFHICAYSFTIRSVIGTAWRFLERSLRHKSLIVNIRLSRLKPLGLSRNEANRITISAYKHLFRRFGMISIDIDVSKEKSTVCFLRPYGEVVEFP